MKSLSFNSLSPSAAIAVGITAIVSQPSYASDYSYESYLAYEGWSYSDTRIQIPALDRAYRRDAPAYHYAYYSIARPEYLL
ncbi:hypothetical protein OsccyDRAFT_1195 [Leptolyngbyaceae cyanobacterium JSC-12]|nr:hypothetical protein OsccyDRAFT_1195 [Leptolyngbyaceae cyanobacterium JSC-12]